jgi:DNA topoisomerase-2
MALSESGHEFQQVSFVNSVCTSGGGVHVDQVYASLWRGLAPIINRKNSGSAKATAGHVASHVWLFINCRIPKPTFDSQARERLLSHGRPVDCGALWQLPDDYVRQGSTFPPACLCQHSPYD